MNLRIIKIFVLENSIHVLKDENLQSPHVSVLICFYNFILQNYLVIYFTSL